MIGIACQSRKYIAKTTGMKVIINGVIRWNQIRGGCPGPELTLDAKAVPYSFNSYFVFTEHSRHSIMLIVP